MLTSDQENIILSDLKANFVYDLKASIPNLMRKSSIDIKLKISELLQTSDDNLLKEAKQFINQSTEIMAQDFLQKLLETVEKY